MPAVPSALRVFESPVFPRSVFPPSPFPSFVRLPLLAAALCAGCASTDSSSAPETAAALDLGGSALVVHYGGLDAFLSDPRDAGLRGALGLLDERLVELAEELGHSAPPGTIELLCEALTAPWTLRVALDGEE